MVKKISAKEFEQAIKQGIIVVDFAASWCGPCKMLAPILEQVSKEMTNVAFYSVDVDDNGDLAKKYGVMSVPTIIAFKNGEKVDMKVGFQPKADLERFIRKNI